LDLKAVGPFLTDATAFSGGSTSNFVEPAMWPPQSPALLSLLGMAVALWPHHSMAYPHSLHFQLKSNASAAEIRTNLIGGIA
jgi:hypothetical protein